MDGNYLNIDWANDFDILNSAYIEDPFSIWETLREECPIAHTDRRKSSWLPVDYDVVTKIAHDINHFSSSEILVIPIMDGEPNPAQPILPYGVPPISADPPLHTWTRRLLLPWFSHKSVERYRSMTTELCNNLIDKIIESKHPDGARDFAQQIPVRVIATMLGVPTDMTDTFTSWVRDFLEFADDRERRLNGARGIFTFLIEEIENRKSSPKNDLISELLSSEFNGKKLDSSLVLGMSILVLVAGIDTTWSAIGSSLYHLATNHNDLERLVAEPELMDLAVEEFLRAYSPVTMARVVTEDIEIKGCPMKKGDKVLMNFPAANRDPKVFSDADKVVIDRKINRHVAFGSGIHRCAGSNLARMELNVSLREWIKRIPRFKLAEGGVVTWAGGQVRGPRELPLEII